MGNLVDQTVGQKLKDEILALQGKIKDGDKHSDDLVMKIRDLERLMEEADKERQSLRDVILTREQEVDKYSG